ncbi:MAG: hypothetical protein WB723_04735 [Candidatus Acidiferrales bacterium]
MRYWVGVLGEMLRAISLPLSELSYWMLAIVPTLTRPVTRVLSSAEAWADAGPFARIVSRRADGRRAVKGNALEGGDSTGAA